VVFSTHIASDVEAAASRILLLYKGKLRFDGPPEELAGAAVEPDLEEASWPRSGAQKPKPDRINR
jgi:ABC-type multidrug transport system ATPase subunit